MTPRLVLIEGGKSVVVRLNLPTVIGRSADAKLTVPHGQVSRRHCELYEHDGQLVVNDLDSANGTQVNRQRIDGPTYLSTGDLLTVGGVTFRTECDDAEDVVDVQDSEVLSFEEGGSSSVQTESAIVTYSESSEGSFIGIETAEEVAPLTDEDEEGLQDFLAGLD